MATALIPRFKVRERLMVLEQLQRNEITNGEAAVQLHLSKRQLLRIKKLFRTEGPEGLIHRLQGSRSNRRYRLALRKEVIKLFDELYDDYGPTLLAETLRRHHQITVSREWIRQLLLKEKRWSVERKSRRHRKKRARREHRGELVQFDGSNHLWLEDRATRCVLLLAIDDATGFIEARLVGAEDTRDVLHFWNAYVQRWGLPRAIYTDFHSVYWNNNHPEQLTDFGRVLKTLHIDHIRAHSPQAKGRVERVFRTLQDRLVKELRRLHLCTIAEANEFLEHIYLPASRKQAAKHQSAAWRKNVHRKCVLTHKERDNIFCFEEQRSVYNDYTITIGGVFFQLQASATALPLPRSKVIVRQWLDGSLHVFVPGSTEELTVQQIPPSAQKPKKAMPRALTIPDERHPWKTIAITRKGAALRSRPHGRKR